MWSTLVVLLPRRICYGVHAGAQPGGHLNKDEILYSNHENFTFYSNAENFQKCSLWYAVILAYLLREFAWTL